MAQMSLIQQGENFKRSIARKLKEAGFLVESEMHNIVAIDTGRLNDSIKTDEVVDRGDILSVDVGSEGVHYAVYVDQGVGGEVYNYHRRSGGSRPVVYTGIGQRWIERSLVAQADAITQKILEARIL